MKIKNRRIISLVVCIGIILTGSAFATSMDLEADNRVTACSDTDCLHYSDSDFADTYKTEDFFVTHYIQEPVIHVFEEPILIERIITYQDDLLADFDAVEETRSLLCGFCDMGTLVWVLTAQGARYRGPQHNCCHGFPRGSDDPWFRNDQWAYRCNRCNWIARTEIRLVTLQEDCYGRN